MVNTDSFQRQNTLIVHSHLLSSILQYLCHDFQIVLLNEALRVKRVRGRMLLDKVMRQLMAHRDPPPAHGLNPNVPARVEVRQMQLLEPVVVEEKRAGLVEGDGSPTIVVEYVH